MMSIDKAEMKHFNGWAKDKNPLFAELALIIATSAKECYQLFEDVKVGKRIEGIIFLPYHTVWIGLYRNHRQIYRSVMSELRNLDDDLSKIIDFYCHMLDAIREVRKMSADEIKHELKEITPEEFGQMQRDLFKELKEHQESIMKDALRDESEDSVALDEVTKKKIRAAFHKPEMIFFWRVLVPCFVIYGTYPALLLRKARTGNYRAIKDLIRLDKSIIEDSAIGEIIHQAAAASKVRKIDIVATALRETPRVKVDMQKVKYLLGGLISLVSIAMGKKIKAVEISRLFDAIALDTGTGGADPDLAVKPWTFEKAIQRARKFWNVIPRQTEKSNISVR